MQRQTSLAALLCALTTCQAGYSSVTRRVNPQPQVENLLVITVEKC